MPRRAGHSKGARTGGRWTIRRPPTPAFLFCDLKTNDDVTEPLTIGVDGCKSGWIAGIATREQDVTLKLFSNLEILWEQYGQRCALLLIDMPIGMIDGGAEGRVCDRLARRMLSPRRHSSIFTPPCRPALYAAEGQASAVNFHHTGKKLSRQTINIMPKMREVDQWIRQLPLPHRQNIRESHPEVIFTALNGGAPAMHNKKNAEGQAERLAILERYQPGCHKVFREARAGILRKNALTDDLIDALALVITAQLAGRYPEKQHRLPATPERDGADLPMEIFYVAP